MREWYVIKTECFPKAWKVVSHHYKDNNDPYNYFLTKELAEKEAKFRNDREQE